MPVAVHQDARARMLVKILSIVLESALELSSALTQILFLST